MNRAFPTRSKTHQLEEQSERFCRNCLPKNWTCEKSEHDYGVDLRIDIFEEGAADGIRVIAAIKGVRSSDRRENGDRPATKRNV